MKNETGIRVIHVDSASKRNSGERLSSQYTTPSHWRLPAVVWCWLGNYRSL